MNKFHKIQFITISIISVLLAIFSYLGSHLDYNKYIAIGQAIFTPIILIIFLLPNNKYFYNIRDQKEWIKAILTFLIVCLWFLSQVLAYPPLSERSIFYPLSINPIVRILVHYSLPVVIFVLNFIKYRSLKNSSDNQIHEK